ncbi:MAG: HPr family phosphocarrier protein [Lachnospiraceae bacterium]|nr:HPr family phosphocarrier protein [Lachnospiraceae bacterium]MDE7031248.1 HPr family phosphocarrier protein [Lachnospiraceae bacterium]
MQKFSYVIKDEVGIHARPAGLLVKEAKKYASAIVLKKGEKSAAATKLMAVMGLGVKCGDTVEVEVQGADEETACAEIRAFFEANL